MKLKILALLSILSLSTAFAMEGHHHSGHSKMKMNKRMTLKADVKKSVIKALEANESLHSSFFDYKGSEIESNAKKLLKSIEDIKSPEISKLLTYSKTKIKEIKESASREENYKNYNLVSMALILVVNKYDVGSKYNAYSCPMVKKKWLQNSKKMAKVHNPYAPQMPHCGQQDSNY